MIDRKQYEEKAVQELGRFEIQVELFRNQLEEAGETGVVSSDKLAAMERIQRRGEDILDRMEKAEEYDAWDAVRCQMDGALSEMRNATRNMGPTLTEGVT
jgi:hypothetical protein